MTETTAREEVHSTVLHEFSLAMRRIPLSSDVLLDLKITRRGASALQLFTGSIMVDLRVRVPRPVDVGLMVDLKARFDYGHRVGKDVVDNLCPGMSYLVILLCCLRRLSRRITCASILIVHDGLPYWLGRLGAASAFMVAIILRPTERL